MRINISLPLLAMLSCYADAYVVESARSIFKSNPASTKQTSLHSSLPFHPVLSDPKATPLRSATAMPGQMERKWSKNALADAVNLQRFVAPMVKKLTAPTTTTLTDVLAYVNHNAMISILPFFLDFQFSTLKLVSAIAYYVGFETWNQFDSEQEDTLSGKNRPILDKRLTLSAWVVSLLVASNPVRAWLLLCPVAYLTKNHTPIKEMLMFSGIYVHFHALGLPLELMTILRIAMCLCIQDVRDMKGDSAIGRVTLPIVLGKHFRLFFALMAVSFFCLTSMPVYSLVGYLFAGFISKRAPKLAYKVYMVNYVMELSLSCL